MDAKFEIELYGVETFVKGSILLTELCEFEDLRLLHWAKSCKGESLPEVFLRNDEGFCSFLSDECTDVLVSAFLNTGVEDDRNKLTPFPDKGLGNELLSAANLFARGALNPLVVEVVLFLCHSAVSVNEELLSTCCVEGLFFSLTLSIAFMLLSDSKGLLK